MSSNADRGPRRSPVFNLLVVLAVIAAFVIAGTYVWNRWSQDDDTSLDNSGEQPVQPAEVPSPNAGAVKAEPPPVATGPRTPAA